jgi:hypothetical protein
LFEAVSDVDGFDDSALSGALLALFDADALGAFSEAVLEVGDAAELNEQDELDALLAGLLLFEESTELASLSAIASEIAEVMDCMLLEACSITPGWLPKIEGDALAAKLLALSVITDAMLSTVLSEVPIIEPGACLIMLLAEA